MKKIKTLFATALLAASVCLLTSCDLLMELLGDYASDYVEDTFNGPENTWLEMTVSYDENSLAADVGLCFFYTEKEKVGHTTNNTRLKKDVSIEPGLTIILYGEFTATTTGIMQKSYYIKEIPLDEGAKNTWRVIYNLSSPLRKLEKKGQLEAGEDGKYSWLSGENYGSWQTYHPDDGEELQPDQERVPEPLTNKNYGKYLTNDDKLQSSKDVDWDAALDKIGLSTKNF